MVTRCFMVVYHSGTSGGRVFLEGSEPVTPIQVTIWEEEIRRATGSHPVAVTNFLPLAGPVPE
jgi:hypothetical protein